MALDFVASGDKLTTATFVVPTAVTYTAWVKDPDFVSSTGPRILENATPTTRWFIDGTTLEFVYQRLFTNTAEWRAPFPTGIDWAQWHHIAVSHDAANTTNDPVFYCDGVALTTSELVTPSGTVSGTSAVMTIGNRPANGRQAGTIAWVCIHNAILTAGQVAIAMDAGFAWPSQFAVWSFEVDGATFPDLSGNGRTATKVGTPTILTGPPLYAGPNDTVVLATFDKADGDLNVQDTNFSEDTYGFGNDGPRILSNVVARTTAGNTGNLDEQAWYDTNTFGPASEAFIRITALPTSSGDKFGLSCRVQTPTTANVDGYHLIIGFNGTVYTWELHSVINQSFTLRTSTTQAVAAGDWIGLTAYGTDIKMWHRPTGGTWTQIGSTVSNAEVTLDGYIGFYIRGTNIRMDMFGGGNIGEISSPIAVTVQALPAVIIPIGVSVAASLTSTLDGISGTPYVGGPGSGIGGPSKGRGAIRGRQRRFRL